MSKKNNSEKFFYPKSIGLSKNRILESLNNEVEVLNYNLEEFQKPFRELTLEDLTDKICQQYTNMYFLKEDDLFCNSDIDQDDEIGDECREFLIKILNC